MVLGEVDVNVEVKPVIVKVMKLQEEKDYKKENICETVKLTTDEKALLLDKKKSKAKKEPKTPKQKKNDKGGKFQMKITGFFSPPGALKKTLSTGSEDSERSRHSSDDTPDSGFASRAETPAVTGDASPKKEEEETVEDAGQEEVKKKFLDDLEDSENEESEKEESSSEEEDSEDDFDPNDSDDGVKKKGFNAKKAPPKRKAVARKQPAMAKPLPGAMKSELSAYEKVREGNIQEREAMLAALMADFSDFKKESGIAAARKRAPPKKRKRVEIDEDGDEVGYVAPREGSRKSARISAKPEDREKLGSEITYSDRSPTRLAEEHSDYDEEDYQVFEDRHKKRAPRPGQIDPNENVLMPEDVTQAMLNKICERFGEKTYNQTIGTTCHQCRQKTTDTKTICRSGECVGVRGQFCGRCLEIRYGEDAREALMDADWKCPPCRGFCNCSICRNRNGKGATGILIQLAQSKGFDNVASYLKALQKKKGNDQFDDEEDEFEEEEGEDEKPKKKKKGKKGKKGKKNKTEGKEVEGDEKEAKEGEDEVKETVEDKEKDEKEEEKVKETESEDRVEEEREAES